MQFTQPIFLWALAGLSVPIAIHLLSRKEGKVIRLGSLRHLQETSTQQFKGIKLNELFLLVLRGLLIILFVLLISGIYWQSNSAKRWLVVESGLEKNPAAKKIIDSLTQNGFEQHTLKKGFPTEKFDDHSKINHWELIYSLNQLELQQTIVLSQSRVEDFGGMRKYVSPTIQWLTLPLENVNFIADVIEQMPEQTFLRRGHSSAEQTIFQTELSDKPIPDSIKISKMPSVSVSIVSDPEFDIDRQIVKASLVAIEKKLPIKIAVSELHPENFSPNLSDWIVWLSETTIPKLDSGKLLSLSIKPSNLLIEQIAVNHWNINKRLRVDVALRENVTIQLANILFNEKEKWSAIAHLDRRILPDSILYNGAISSLVQASTRGKHPISKYIVVLFLVLLFIERIVAHQRNQ